MAASPLDAERPEIYRRFEHDAPEWYRDAKLGIFVHWGPYSVPAWAEPTGELGTIDPKEWFAHNPYAEWYLNTIRIDGSPALEHQRTVFGGADYYDFLDSWDASQFDPDELVSLFKRAGARYLVPVTKHHDGVTLWEAPGNPSLNTVARGPKKDLVEAWATAARKQGVRFGAYYSGGLDWSRSTLPAIDDVEKGGGLTRPSDPEYAQYAYDHVIDLIDRYKPEVLWGDINWPDAGKPEGPFSLVEMFDHYYREVPDGLVNDRWGITHWDFVTSEYQQGLELEKAAVWENCRGIGFSFGYNQLEDESVYLDGPGVVKHFVDVVSRGGNFLLNVGPKADGTLPEVQRRTLNGLADWNEINGDAIFGSRVADPDVASPSNEPWVRWTRTGDRLNAIVDAVGEVVLRVAPEAIDSSSATIAGAGSVTATFVDGGVHVTIPTPSVAGPSVVTLTLR